MIRYRKHDPGFPFQATTARRLAATVTATVTSSSSKTRNSSCQWQSTTLSVFETLCQVLALFNTLYYPICVHTQSMENK